MSLKCEPSSELQFCEVVDQTPTLLRQVVLRARSHKLKTEIYIGKDLTIRAEDVSGKDKITLSIGYGQPLFVVGKDKVNNYFLTKSKVVVQSTLLIPITKYFTRALPPCGSKDQMNNFVTEMCREGLACKAHGLLYHSTLGLRVMKSRLENYVSGKDKFTLSIGYGQPLFVFGRDKVNKFSSTT